MKKVSKSIGVVKKAQNGMAAKAERMKANKKAVVDGGEPVKTVPQRKAEFLEKEKKYNDSIKAAKKQNGGAVGSKEVNITKAKNGKAMKGKCKNGCK